MARILIIDDDKAICLAMTGAIQQIGHDVTSALSLKEGIEKISTAFFDVVYLDVRLPDGSGLDALPMIKNNPSAPEVIIITAEGEPDGAELAIKNGAWDYIEKPSTINEMTLPLIRALQYREKKEARSKAIALKQEGIIGSSPRMKECFNLIAQAADSEVNILITGETGTGKELFARAVHENSSRKNNSFLIVDCTTLPETLVESVLFGHIKGAFTGADSNQDGLIKQADGGTLFLDEVGELSPSTQKRFLRALQEHRFRPIGGKREIESNFRLVAATNRDLEDLTEQGHFRKDLLFRLRSLTIDLPSLRERRSDIKALAMYHVARLCERYESEVKGFSPDFFRALEAFDWPGNVRELFNSLERAVAAAGSEPILFPDHLATDIRAKAARASLITSKHGKIQPPWLDVSEDLGLEAFPGIQEFRNDMEQQYLEKLMGFSRGSRQEACRLSGLSRTRLFELLKKHRITA